MTLLARRSSFSSTGGGVVDMNAELRWHVGRDASPDVRDREKSSPLFALVAVVFLLLSVLDKCRDSF